MCAIQLSNKDDSTELGYEDIYSASPYIDAEKDGERSLVHMLYVPPSLRKQGLGRKLFEQFLVDLPTHIKYVRLKSAKLGSGDTMPFWRSIGFTPAYECTCEDNMSILHLAVNGFELPPVEKVVDEDERHYIFD